MAPLWPLQNFVAVNPFSGLTGASFVDAAALMARMTAGGMLIERSYFRARAEAGAITRADLDEALALLQGSLPGDWQGVVASLDQDRLHAWLAADGPAGGDPGVETLAELVDRMHGTDWSPRVIDEISKWCAAYFDGGQALWPMPWRDRPLYDAWRQAACIDASPEIIGLRGFRAFAADLPWDSAEALGALASRIGLDPDGAVDFLHRELLSVGGWAGCVQFRLREGIAACQHGLVDLLAIRLAYDAAVLALHDGPELREHWIGHSEGRDAGEIDRDRLDLAAHLVWQTALEVSYQRTLIGRLLRVDGTGQVEANEDRVPAGAGRSAARPSAQMVFCIDVRSEPMRRAIESVDGGIATLGFAGFFGMPIEVVPFGERSGSARCPVLLKPAYRVAEGIRGNAEAEKSALKRTTVRRAAGGAWKRFKDSAVSCFTFVEAAGLGYGWKLVRDGLRPGPAPRRDDRIAPHADGCGCAGERAAGLGIPAADQALLAENALRRMGLTDGFARLVVMCGHGSTTTNNPYGSGLDCGACGGHAGDANARLLVDLLNRPEVRDLLLLHGIVIPSDTWFVAGIHDTTTDEIRLFDAGAAPASHAEELQQLENTLAEAGKRARRERAPKLGVETDDDERTRKEIGRRTVDWSQVRPEWGLAGNAAFVAAPRERTRGLGLDGRVFLHEYHVDRDPDRSTLELILCAPMVVANWINLQYYASTANHAEFGSGNKTLHNVTGTHGVLLGNGGDLRTGLPWQSLHDGSDWRHEPLRLSVLVEAPEADIDAILARHPEVAELVDNGWLHLFALAGTQRLTACSRRLPGGRWIDADGML